MSLVKSGAVDAPAVVANDDSISHDQDLLNQLDQCVDRMRTLISDEPYITTIPQDEPRFHHPTRLAADAWLMNSPFERNENYQVQYQSFFYRDPYSDIYERVRYSHFDRPHAPVTVTTATTATNTPTVGPKKKISLAAYNKNKKAQEAASTPSQTQQSNKSDVTKDQAKPTIPLKEEDKHAIPIDSPKTQDLPILDAPVPNQLKRKQPPTKSPELSKKQRLSPQPEPHPISKIARSNKSQMAPDSEEQKYQIPDLPPGRLSPLDSLYLPGRLSPTLPPNIVLALDEAHHSRSTSDGSKHDSVFSNLADPIADAPDSHSSRKHDAQHDEQHESPEPRLSRIVKLKIPKRLNTSFRRLVQFLDRKTKDRKAEQPVATTHRRSESIHNQEAKVKSEKQRVDDEADVKGVARKVTHSSRPAPAPAPLSNPTPAGKRLRPPDQDSALSQAKRKKPPPPSLKVDKDASATPVQSSFRSPALPQSANKSQQATPSGRKNVPRTSFAMKRVESTDAIESTPAHMDGTPAKPPPSQTSSNIRPSPSSTAARTPESQAWSAEFSRLIRLAKELKHAAPNPPDVAGELNNKERKQAEAAALASLDAFLTFILAFSCNDRSYAARSPPQLSDPQNWISCHGFWLRIKALCSPFPHLCGLADYISAVYNGVIMRRLTATNANVSARPDAHKNLQEAVVAGLRSADDATTKLPLATLKAEYPQTWKRGMMGSSDGDKDATPGHYDGGFSFPLGVNSDPFEAVGFAHSLLAEWASKRDLEYKMKLKLSA